ncbi:MULTISPECIES: SGNH/GDSL hydrolase family protein [Leptolyngbya]|uniref:SGNH/GDSL hydrolase family protein n=1 Tax=Leptolyngbya TaxID=47251 RepID=UPI00168532DE|nr:SGNH/GDSL hydrolase family protein [Leptolyngbya sp. FACHB-1624]MBD1856033.1 SGNH/GDSL hydrolase family protein [Leptolyngbya sp. FACHB-1624]
MKLKPFMIVLLGLGVSIAMLELGLRLIFGFGNPPLLQVDQNTGYRFQPNQKLFRFGKYIEINQYSQRNSPISAIKSPNTRRILMIGDSVLNGGVQTDQAYTITEQFRELLGGSIEVLNASTGSWGIENRIGYLLEFGSFQSDVIIFQIGTSDLIQRTGTGTMIGVDPSFPNQRPWSAIEEVWSRYLLRRFVRQALIIPAYAEVRSPQDKAAWFARNSQSFRAAVRSLRTNPETKSIPILVLYTPNRDEVTPTPQQPLYKAEFFALLKQLKIPVVDVHQSWASLPVEHKTSYFIDEIHLSETGNQAVSDLLFQQLCVQAKSTWCRQ